MITMTQHIA
ncbi:hypothetical protein VCCP1047_2671, partial [Vibrio cholerae CP1047(20)]